MPSQAINAFTFKRCLHKRCLRRQATPLHAMPNTGEGNTLTRKRCMVMNVFPQCSQIIHPWWAHYLHSAMPSQACLCRHLHVCMRCLFSGTSLREALPLQASSPAALQQPIFSALLHIIHETENALAARRAQQLTMQLPNQTAKRLRVGAGFLEVLSLPRNMCAPTRICLLSCERLHWLRKLMAPCAEAVQLGQPGHCHRAAEASWRWIQSRQDALTSAPNPFWQQAPPLACIQRGKMSVAAL